MIPKKSASSLIRGVPAIIEQALVVRWVRHQTDSRLCDAKLMKPGRNTH
jgi:hypothetical protein